MMSRAVLVRTFGPPNGFGLESHDPGPPGPGAVRVRVAAAGVSFVDVLVTEGGYQLRPPLPFVPGSESAGVVETVGPGVDPARLGERVCVAAFGGAWGEAIVVPAGLAVPIPAAMAMDEAAVFRVSYATAHAALVRRGGLRAGELLCVLGAGGAVGRAAVEVGKALGAVVIASASTPEKRAAALQAGADAAIEADAADWRDRLKAASGGQGPDVVLDPLGGHFTEPAFRSLAFGGRHLVVGFAAGAIPRLPTNLALVKGAALIGVDVRRMGEAAPAEMAADLDTLFAWWAGGKLRPAIARRLPLERFAEAMAAAKAGGEAGRIVLTTHPG